MKLIIVEMSFDLKNGTDAAKRSYASVINNKVSTSYSVERKTQYLAESVEKTKEYLLKKHESSADGNPGQ